MRRNITISMSFDAIREWESIARELDLPRSTVVGLGASAMLDAAVDRDAIKHAVMQQFSAEGERVGPAK